MTINDYAQAGYNGMESMRPPHPSSPFGMAFECGVWCKAHHVTPYLVHESRGYTWIVNKTYKLNFKNSDTNPTVTRIGERT